MAFGRPDVDAFLASLDGGTVDRWFEYYKLEPWGDDWERSSMQTAEIINAIAALASGFGGRDAKPPEPIPSDAFVPYREHRRQRGDFELGLKELDAMRGL